MVTKNKVKGTKIDYFNRCGCCLYRNKARLSVSQIFVTVTKRFYFYVNGSIGIVQKIEFEMRPDLGCITFKTSIKEVLDNPSVCLSVCVPICLCARLSVLL